MVDSLLNRILLWIILEEFLIYCWSEAIEAVWSLLLHGKATSAPLILILLKFGSCWARMIHRDSWSNSGCVLYFAKQPLNHNHWSVSIRIFIVFQADDWFIIRKVDLNLQCDSLWFACHHCLFVHFEVGVEHNNEVMFMRRLNYGANYLRQIRIKLKLDSKVIKWQANVVGFVRFACRAIVFYKWICHKTLTVFALVQWQSSIDRCKCQVGEWVAQGQI